jgi:hypothetical protein
MLLWCAAVLDMRQPAQLLRKLLQQLHGASELPTHAMAQLVQVHMWLEVSKAAVWLEVGWYMWTCG